MSRLASLLLCLLISALSWGIASSAEPVVVRMAVDPENGIWVGQQVQLRIDVLGLDGWATFERLPRLELSGAQVLRVESQGVRLNETIDGAPYTGQRYQWLVFPKRAGSFEVPAVPVQVSVKTFGTGIEPQIHAVETPPVSFQAVLPTGAENISDLISTASLRVSQIWEPEEPRVSAGDGIRRRIVLEVEGIAGMAFTPLSHAPIDGVAIYPGEPQVTDKIERGTLDSGNRIETVTYVAEQPGEVRLPDITYSWWDTDNKVLRQETLEGITLEVSPAPTSGQGASVAQSMKDDLGSLKLLIAAFVVAVLAGFIWFWIVGLKPRWKDYQARRRERESAYFRRFLDAAATGGPDQAMRKLMRWLDRLDLPKSPALLEDFVTRYGDDRARAEARRLVSVVAGSEEAGWNGRPLASAMTVARRRFLDDGASSRERTSPALPPLNPASSG